MSLAPRIDGPHYAYAVPQVINDYGTQVVDTWAFNADDMKVTRAYQLISRCHPPLA